MGGTPLGNLPEVPRHPGLAGDEFEAGVRQLAKDFAIENRPKIA
jgi:hypothetical protein